MQILTEVICANVDFSSSITEWVISARGALTALSADIDSFAHWYNMSLTIHDIIKVAKSDQFSLHLFPDSWKNWRPGSRSWTRELKNWKRGRSLGMRCHISRAHAFKIAWELANQDQDQDQDQVSIWKGYLYELKKYITANPNRTVNFSKFSFFKPLHLLIRTSPGSGTFDLSGGPF